MLSTRQSLPLLGGWVDSPTLMMHTSAWPEVCARKKTRLASSHFIISPPIRGVSLNGDAGLEVHGPLEPTLAAVFGVSGGENMDFASPHEGFKDEVYGLPEVTERMGGVSPTKPNRDAVGR